MNLLKLCLSSAFANFVQPVFTLFLPLVARGLGASVLEIGIVGGASSFVYAFMPFVMGRISDKGNARRLLIVSSLALLSLVSVLYFFAASPPILIILRVLEGLGWAMFWPSMDSAVTHGTRMDPRRALSLFNLSWSSAAALGPLAGSFVVVAFSIRDVFLFNAIILVSALFVYGVPRRIRNRTSMQVVGNNEEHRLEIIHSEEITASKDTNGGGESVEKITQTSQARARISPVFYILSVVLCTIATNTMASFFSPYASVQGISIIVIGAVSFTYGGFRFLGYLMTTSKRVRDFFFEPARRVRNVFLLLLVLILSSLLMLIHNSTGLVYFLSFGLVGLSYSFVYFTAMIALLAEASRERMGAGAGVFEMSIGIGSFTGPVVAGVVSGNSLTIPFVVPFLSAIPITPVLYFLSRPKLEKP